MELNPHFIVILKVDLFMFEGYSMTGMRRITDSPARKLTNLCLTEGWNHAWEIQLMALPWQDNSTASHRRLAGEHQLPVPGWDRPTANVTSLWCKHQCGWFITFCFFLQPSPSFCSTLQLENSPSFHCLVIASVSPMWGQDIFSVFTQ